MRRQKILLLLVVSFLLILGTVYLIGKKPVEAPSSIPDSGGISATQILEQSGPSKLKDLFNFDQSLICQVNSVSSNRSAFSGTVYITESSIRGDFDTQQAGQLFTSSMILVQDAYYFWTDSPDGKKTFKTDPTIEAVSNLGEEFPIDLEETINYECEPWSSDPSKFVLPSDLDFS